LFHFNEKLVRAFMPEEGPGGGGFCALSPDPQRR
jgi:hypothetical protein